MYKVEKEPSWALSSVDEVRRPVGLSPAQAQSFDKTNAWI